MARLSWNEIEIRASQFAARWKGETYEKGESQSFWTEFLDVYGIDRRRSGALFEHPTKKLSGKQGFIDLFWPGKLIAEQKSAGRDLDKASDQALDYLYTLPDHDLPQFIVACDFAIFQVLELATGKKATFTLDQFPTRVKIFAFLIDESSQTVAEEDPVNREAAEGMARLHNQLRDSRYTGHDLELLLVRLVFCLFADDSQIFERGSFERYLRNRTGSDGSDLGLHLGKVFEVLNTPEEERQTTLDQDLQFFPYINGGLFEQTLRTPSCTSGMRRELLEAARLNWSQVSPAIFGSMFQGVMDETQRRNLGAHYTSERNILRVIKPLFLDDLYAEYARVRLKPTELRKFHQKLSTLNFLDPACGCGNFLVITYRELRRLEHKVVQDLFKGQRVLDVASMLRVNVNQMHGIEIEEFPSRIAQTALWLTDHQMNLEASELLGQHYVRLPLTASANIVNANALTTDWEDVVPAEKLSYILGNPPFVGQTWQSPIQKAEVAEVLKDIPRTGVLDFVSAWYGKATDVMTKNPNIQTALVSTNSISQGEQVGVLWGSLLKKGVVINFAHRTFRWTNDASGVAAVHCVIIGFALRETNHKRIFDYADISGDPIETGAKNINPYLVDAPSILITSRRTPINGALPMTNGNKPVEGGNLILSDVEKDKLILGEPMSEQYIKRLVGSRELLQGINRWCLWLIDIDPATLRKMPKVIERVAKVKAMREASVDSGARKLASRPTQFRDISNPESYIAVPEVSSERRDYIPMAFFNDDVICTNKIQIVANAGLYNFAILASRMHMAWTQYVCGRLKSDYSYSKDIVYNNFPWPDATDAQQEQLGKLAQGILDARANYPDSTLADLYDPLTMPPDLRKAHDAVDRFVDRLYRKAPFATDADRVALLFKLYQDLTHTTQA